MLYYTRIILDSDRFKPFGIIFIDPPYDTNFANSCLARLDRMVKKVKTVIVEQNSRQVEMSFFPKRLHHVRDYRYGSTVISFFTGDLVF